MAGAAGEEFRTFDHTGDLGLEVRAGTPERLYGLAAEALMAQIALAPHEAQVRVAVDLDGDDPHDLLIHWLNTALLHGSIERAVWTRVQVHSLTPRRIVATLEGPRVDPARHTLLREVKAVSHHHLELDLTPGACRCRLVLDI